MQLRSKYPCGRFAGRRETAIEREEERGEEEEEEEKTSERRRGTSRGPAERRRSGGWSEEAEKTARSLRARGILLPPGARLAPCAWWSCGSDERDSTMRSDPVLFTSSRGEWPRGRGGREGGRRRPRRPRRPRRQEFTVTRYARVAPGASSVSGDESADVGPFLRSLAYTVRGQRPEPCFHLVRQTLSRLFFGIRVVFYDNFIVHTVVSTPRGETRARCGVSQVSSSPFSAT